MKLSLACGNNKPEGFIGVDFVDTDSVDVVHNLLEFPWPFEDNSVDEIECSHFVEHIPHGDDAKDLFFQFFDEVYRVLKPAEYSSDNPNIPICGFANIVAPYYSSMRCWQDPTHKRAISEANFLYLNKQWREDNRLDHYLVDCDFDFSYSYAVDQFWGQRNAEMQAFAFKNYINSINDIYVTLIKNR